MFVQVFEDKEALGKAAAARAAAIIRDAIAVRAGARIVVATGASQFEFLDSLTKSPSLYWQKVELFQLDEYVGLPMTHPASFSKYIQERLADRTGIVRYHALNGEEDPAEVIRTASAAIRMAPIDVAFVGIGENGHLAFNDPPADFETNDCYILVNLDEACRRQQVGEGWFAQLSEVPERALSMSVRQILQAKEIIAVVPDARKAQAVKACLEGPISPSAPASILRTHAHATIYLDKQSASLLDETTLSAASSASEEPSPASPMIPDSRSTTISR
ncbi:MAG: glucosamine-6-phosphate deaminase [Candidatus Acidiferrum sp.]